MSNSVSTTIADGAATSLAVNLGAHASGAARLVGVQFPASMTGTAMTFHHSFDGQTYVPVREVGGANPYSITVTSSTYVPVDARVFAGSPYIKCVSGSSESGAKALTLAIRPVGL